MKKIFFVLMGLLLAWVSANYFWQRQQKKFEEMFKSADVSGIQTVSPSQFLQSNQITQKEFVSPDGKLKIKYTLMWLEIKDENTLKQLIPTGWQEKYTLRTLLLAQEASSDKLSRLIVSEGYF